MRIAGGDKLHIATDGTRLNVDQDMGQELTDLLAAIIHRSGATPDTVLAITLHGEAPPVIELTPARRKIPKATPPDTHRR